MFGKGMHVKPPLRQPRSLPSLSPKRGRGMHINPPPFFGSWDDYIKKNAVKRNGEYEYFDSFGLDLPPPNEWESELKKLGKRSFLRNDNQLQWVGSVRFGY